MSSSHPDRPSASSQVSSPASYFDGPSYFDRSPFRSRHASLSHEHRSSISNDSTDVSPGTLTRPSHAERFKTALARPSRHRSRSDHDPSANTRIYPISEGGPSQFPRQRRSSIGAAEATTGSKLMATFPEKNRQLSATSKITSSSVNAFHSRGITQQDSSKQGSDSANDNTPTSRGSSKTMWTRTYSGSVWFKGPEYEKHKEPKQLGESFHSSLGINRLLHHYRTEPQSVALKPLRPPLQAHQLHSTPSGSNLGVPKSVVTIETTFPEQATRPSLPTRNSAKASFRPRVVIASTWHLLRRLSNTAPPKLSLGKSVESGDTYVPPGTTSAHSTNLRRNQTDNILHRASSLLNVSSILSKTSGASGTSKARPSPKHPGGSSSPKLLCISRTPNPSISSSVEKFRRGKAPPNTPENSATYKVTNVQSGEEETFFKVDISVRGGTSYLPSEARRIHTPPMPGEDPMGKRRGFFFDYNTPCCTPPVQRDVGLVRQPCMSESWAGPQDWYDLQLSRLDSSPGLHSDKSRAHFLEHSKDHNWKKHGDKVTIDYDIPEHLPSSPLCPKHAKYWRFVQGKLKAGEEEERVCWMHGFRQH